MAVSHPHSVSGASWRSVTQGKDLGVLVPIAHRQQTQHRERIRYREVGQS